MTSILVVNRSTLVTDDQVKIMTRACAQQLTRHAAPVWGKTPIPVVFSSTLADAAPGMWVIAVLDDSDQAGALGWHTEDQGELIYGRVFAKPVLDNGGDVLSKPLSVASVLSHEVLEAFVDPNVNGWCDNGNGQLIALEVCDPVESDSYTVTVSGQPVTVSNFVGPHWFDPSARTGLAEYDWMGKVTAPFTMSPGGYWVQMVGGQVTQKFGETFPEWKRATKQVDTARAGRRVAEGAPPPPPSSSSVSVVVDGTGAVLGSGSS